MKFKNLLKRVQDRNAGLGYGLSTADKYIQRAFAECGAGLTCRSFGNTQPVEQLVRDASQKLVFCNEDMVAIKAAASDDNFGGLLPDNVKAPDGTLMVLQHVVTTPREDRDGDILVTEGATIDPMCPLLWQHMHTLPIGKMIAVVEHTPERLVVVSSLLDLNEITRDAALLIRAGALRFSHGFRAQEVEERTSENGGFAGFKILKFEIMEVSLVSVPSNVDAEIELYSSGKLASDLFKKHAAAMQALVVKGQVQGAEGCQCGSNGSQDGEGGQQDDGQGSTEGTQGGQDGREDSGESGESGQDGGEDSGEGESENGKGGQDGTKGGRVLSTQNAGILKEVVGDLEEMRRLDLPRQADALCERCVNKIKGLLDAAANDDEPKQPGQISVAEAAAMVLRSGDSRLLLRLRDGVNAMFETEAADKIAADYRAAVSN